MKRKIIVLLLFIPLWVLAAGDVRPYLQTGPWYPADATQLQKMLDGFFAQVPPAENPGAIVGLIAPHAGYAYSGLCAARAYRRLAGGRAIQRVILLGSSHHRGYYGACVSDHSAYATPLGTVAVDTGICRTLAAKKIFKSDRGIMANEHSIENQLPFLQKALARDRFKIVPILFGSLDKKDFAALAETIAAYIDGQTLVVASSDLTHYGENFAYTPFADDLKNRLTVLDAGLIETIERLDFENYWRYREKTGITTCGFVPMGIMIKLFAGKNTSCSRVDYSKSGDRNGDYSTSVSYASLLFTRGGAAADGTNSLDGSEQKLLLELARTTLLNHFQNKRISDNLEIGFAKLPKLRQKLGVFVTLRRNGELRGCIGSIVGVEPLCRGVAANAIHAAIDDPRFAPLRPEELARIKIEISVMTPLRPVDDYRVIRLGTDGVVIRDGSAQAVFLPQVATETGWSLEQFMGRLCQKAGLERDTYKTSRTMQFFIFQAQVFSEKDHHP